MPRKHRNLSALLALTLTFWGLTALPSQATLINGCDPAGSSFSGILGASLFGGGTGQANTPWLICSRSHLEQVANSNVPNTAHYKLATDIDLGPKSDPTKNWIPIMATTFQGSLDGNFFSIKNLYVTGARTQYGLFASLGPATIKNIQFVDAEILSSATASEEGGSGTLPSGGIVAASNNGTKFSNLLLTRPKLHGNLRSASFIVGESYWISGSGTTIFEYIKVVGGYITSTHNSTSKPQLAGLVGITRGATVYRVSLEGEIVGPSTGAKIAGITSWANWNPVTVDEAFIDIDINANAPVGGFDYRIGGFVGESAMTTIRDSYYVGQISNALTNYVGGIGGYLTILPQRTYVTKPVQYSASITNLGQLVGATFTKNDDSTSVFYLKDTADERFINTYGFPTRKTDAELKTKATFESTGWLIEDAGSASVTSGWSLNPNPPNPSQKVWKISPNTSYPTLVWLDFWPSLQVSAPTSLVASSTQPEEVTVSWDPATSSGFDSTIIGYKIESSIDNGATWVVAVADTGNVTSKTISSLSPGSYRFRVSALAGNVTGSPTTATTSVTVAASTPPSYAGPIIKGFSSSRLLVNQPMLVIVTGERLGQIQSAAIDGLPVKILRKSDSLVELELPALTLGPKSLRLVSDSGVLTHQDAFVIVSTGSVGVGASGSKLTIGFLGNKSFLTGAARMSISSRVTSSQSIERVVCTGFTSGRRATAFDQRLALRRAQAACSFVASIRPDAQRELRTSPASGLGPKFRSASLEFFGN